MSPNKETPLVFFPPVEDSSKASPKKEALEQSKEFAIVIEACDKDGVYDLGLDEYRSHLPDLARSMGCDYWTILHDSDFDDDGNRKRLHWHLVIRMKRSRRIKNAVIKGVAKSFGIEKERVSVLFSYDLETDIRYLMHLDDEEKTLYPMEDVITSDMRSLALAFAGSLNQLTMERLEDAYVAGGGTMVGIMRLIGIKLYRLNAVVIHDYINERKQYGIVQKKEEEES